MQHQFLTLTRFKQRLGLVGVSLGADGEARLSMALRAAEMNLIAQTGREYAPVRLTRRMIAPARSGATLALSYDLLTVEAVMVDGEAVAQVELVGGALLVRTDGGVFDGGDVQITGLWAMHGAPWLAWRDSGSALTVGANSSQTTLSVLSPDGFDEAGESPRLMVGHLLRVGAELMRVVAVGTGEVTVRRAVNGTQAGAAAAGTPIRTFAPDVRAESLGYRWAAWLYREIDGDPLRPLPPALDFEVRRLRREAV
jgi:hypothetical protein